MPATSVKSFKSLSELELSSINEKNIVSAIALHRKKESAKLNHPEELMEKMENTILKVINFGKEEEKKSVLEELVRIDNDLLTSMSNTVQYAVLEYGAVTDHLLYCRSEDEKMLYTLMRRIFIIRVNNGKYKTTNVCLKGTELDANTNILPFFYDVNCPNGMQFGVDKEGLKSGQSVNTEGVSKRCHIAFSHANNLFIRDYLMDQFYSFNEGEKNVALIPLIRQPYFFESKGEKFYSWGKEEEKQYKAFFEMFEKKEFAGIAVNGRHIFKDSTTGWDVGVNGEGENNMWNKFRWIDFLPESPKVDATTKQPLAEPIEYLSRRKLIPLPEKKTIVIDKKLKGDELEAAKKKKKVADEKYLEELERVMEENKWYMRPECWDLNTILGEDYNPDNYYPKNMNLGNFSYAEGDKEQATLDTLQIISDNLEIVFFEKAWEKDFEISSGFRKKTITRKNKMKKNVEETVEVRIINPPKKSDNNTKSILDKKGRPFYFYNGPLKNYTIAAIMSWCLFDDGSMLSDSKIRVRKTSAKLYANMIMVTGKMTFGSSDAKVKRALGNMISSMKSNNEEEGEPESEEGSEENGKPTNLDLTNSNNDEKSDEPPKKKAKISPKVEEKKVVKRKAEESDEEDEPPKKKFAKKVEESEEEDELPKKKPIKKVAVEESDEPPKKKPVKKVVVEESEEDDEPPKKKPVKKVVVEESEEEE